MKMDDLYLKLHYYTPGSKGCLLMSPDWSIMLHVTWSGLLAAMLTALPALYMLRVTWSVLHGC